MSNTFTVAEELNEQGRVLHSVGKYDEALELYKKAEEADAMYVQSYINEGEAYVMLDKMEEAKAAFSKVLLIDKQNAEVYFHLGNIEFLNDNIEEGKELYAKAINAGYTDAHLYYNLGTINEEANLLDEALKCYNKAIAKDKFYAEAKLRKIKIFVQQNLIEEAIQAADSMIEYTPDVFEGHHYKVLLLAQLDRYDEAQAALDKARELFPDDEDFIFDNVLLLEKQNKLDEALNLIDEKLDGEIREVKLEKAKILLAKGETEAAVELFEGVRAAETEIYDAEVRFYLFNIYMGLEKFEKAIECCEENIKNCEHNTYYNSALYIKAEALRRLGKETEAKEVFSYASNYYRMECSGNAGNLELYIYRALCYKALKQYDKAFEMVNYLLAINENFGDAYLIRSEIYRELNETEKAEADKQMAASKSRLINSILG